MVWGSFPVSFKVTLWWVLVIVWQCFQLTSCKAAFNLDKYFISSVLRSKYCLTLQDEQAFILGLIVVSGFWGLRVRHNMLAMMIVHMVYYIKETFVYCGVYVAQIFNFILNSPVLLRKPTSIGFQTVIMIWNSTYFRSWPERLDSISFFESFYDIRRV